ncbi:MAG: hypothetical protein M3541_19945, partial [Acidobacteriota bacterium]|nr:hypothetical protein [Acidobacteriota bacterium]
PGEHPTPLQSVKERSAGAAIEFFAAALSDISDELDLNLRYDLNSELADLDVLELIRRLKGATDYEPRVRRRP